MGRIILGTSGFILGHQESLWVMLGSICCHPMVNLGSIENSGIILGNSKVILGHTES